MLIKNVFNKSICEAKYTEHCNEVVKCLHILIINKYIFKWNKETRYHVFQEVQERWKKRHICDGS